MAVNNRIESAIQRFASRKCMSRKHDVSYQQIDGKPCLFLDSFILLARFASELRQTLHAVFPKAVLLCRGQSKPTSNMMPSLFREKNKGYPASLLREAEQLVVERIQKSGLKRFKRHDLPPLLQHYGVCTSWLDVVDNLFVAVWFATHTYDKTRRRYFTNALDHCGWIYFISTENQAGCLRHVDLRESQHHLSVRPHVQHGWSVTLETPPWSDGLRTLDDFVVASVCLSKNPNPKLDYGLLTASHLFPSTFYDNTLKFLSNRVTDSLLRQTEKDKGLRKGSLGSLFDPKTDEFSATRSSALTSSIDNGAPSRAGKPIGGYNKN
jgi:hypothetical protein